MFLNRQLSDFDVYHYNFIHLSFTFANLKMYLKSVSLSLKKNFFRQLASNLSMKLRAGLSLLKEDKSCDRDCLESFLNHIWSEKLHIL